MSQDPSLEPYAMAMGQLCHAWAELESSSCGTLVYLAGMPNNGTSYAVARCFDFRDRLAAIKVAAMAVTTEDAWQDALFDTVDYVDNTLRNRRNRFIHDDWIPAIDSRGVQRVNMTPKIHKPQARQRPKLKHAEGSFETVTDITETTDEILSHAEHLRALTDWLEYPEYRAELPNPLSELPQRRFPRPQLEKQRPRGSGGVQGAAAAKCCIASISRISNIMGNYAGTLHLPAPELEPPYPL